MNLGIFGSLLALVLFSWDAPPAEDNISKVEIHISNTSTYDPAGQVIDAGLPPVVAGKQSFSTMLDVSTPKWAWIQGRNSFGLSDPQAVGLKVGKPSPITGRTASPN